MKNKGSMMVLFIPALMGLFILTALVIRWEHAQWTMGKAQVVAEQSLLSSLRVKAESFAQIAEKWEPLRKVSGGAEADAVLVEASQWSMALKVAQNLKNSLSGYKGRIQSVGTVVMEANGIRREALTRSGPALQLDVVSKGQWMKDPSGAQIWADGYWVGRNWAPLSRLGQPDEIAIHEVVLTDPHFGPVVGRAVARVRWDVSLKNPTVKTYGNGGFPRDWHDAVQDGRIEPFRYPFFRTETLHSPVTP